MIKKILKDCFEAVMTVVKEGLTTSPNDSTKKEKNTEHNTSSELPVSTAEQIAHYQRLQQLELNNVSDYVCRATPAIPAYLNLDTSQNRHTLNPKKLEENTYSVCLYKRELEKKFSKGDFETLKEALDSALRCIRFEAERSVQVAQENLKNKLWEIEIKQNYCPSYENCAWDTLRAQNTYRLTLNHSLHLLYGLEVVSFDDYPDFVVIILQCDPRNRIPLMC